MKRKIPIDVYKPSTHRIFLSLSSAPKLAEKLLGSGKEYDAFLQQLLEHNFFEPMDKKVTVKGLAERFKLKPLTVTKWVERIYEDVFLLNEERPDLFQTRGIKHTLSFRYTHGQSAWLTVWLETTPRIHERFSWYFVKAKVGCDCFWVKEIHHSIEDVDHTITLYLVGGYVNKYREWLVDRAKFERVIGIGEEMHLEECQIDDRLKSHYHNHHR